MKTSSVILIPFMAVMVLSCNGPSPEGIQMRQELITLLPEGNSTVHIFGEVAYSDPRLLELQKKMTESIQLNADWFSEYKQKFGLPLPYHLKLGLSLSEYKELLLLYEENKPELVKTGEGRLEIIHKKNKFLFKGNRSIDFFNDLVIDFRDNTIEMNGHELVFLGEESAADSINVFRSKWQGYAWQFLEPENALQIPPKDLKKENARIYKITIGELDRGNRTLIIVKGLEFNKGKKVFDFEAPMIL